MNFQIIILNANNFMIHDYIKSKIVYDDIHDFINENSTLVTIESSNQLLGTIINTLGMTEDIMGHTTTIKESETNLVQMCHLLDDEHFKSNKDKNGLAALFYKGLLAESTKEEVRGPVICIKSNILADGTYSNSSLETKELAAILYRNCVKRGIVLNKNAIDEIEYIIEPIENMTIDEKANLKFFEFNALDHVIKIFVEINPSFDHINEPLSALFGRHLVKGRGFVILQNVDGKFIDLDTNTFMKLLAIMSDKKIKDKEENGANKENTNIQPNFYLLLDNQYKKFRETYKDKLFLTENNGQADRPCLNQLVQLQLSKQI